MFHVKHRKSASQYVSRETYKISRNQKENQEKTVNFEAFKQKTIEIFALNPILPTPTDEQIEKLFALTEIMLEVNKSMNLTAITEEKSIILKHYADSLSICSHLKENSTVIDVGCGAGFPTLPLAIFRPDLKITALDGTAKRIEYVKSTAELLGLNNVCVSNERAEALGQGPLRESFDYATARAVAALPILSELCIPFVKKDGYFIAMKAAQGENEAAAAQNAIKLCGGINTDALRLKLTADGESFEERLLIKVKKISQTPQKYPRHYSQISKKPL
jgi:16S rRNA (guanine527-N7)-methyltransferase